MKDDGNGMSGRIGVQCRERRAVTMVLIGAVLALAGPSSACAQVAEQRRSEQSCRDFVQQFYDWYVATSAAAQRSRTAGPAGSVVLRFRPQVLAPELAQLLREDNDAQAKAHELVGLDFDPFLNSQDPSPKFAVASVSLGNGNCRAVVFGFMHGTRQERVVPELTAAGANWVFVNIHYGKSRASEDENLISVLKDLAEQRRKHWK